MTHLACTVTTDLNYDQRMQRICDAMVRFGYQVSLSGCQRPGSKPLQDKSYRQFRLLCFFKRGILHYAEYNFKLFFHLIRLKPDVIYSVDLDTLCAGSFYCIFFRKPLIFDSHEYFTELPELAGKPIRKAIWGIIGKLFIKRAVLRITVAQQLSEVLSQRYHAPFEVIRNVPVWNDEVKSALPDVSKDSKIILYQGALNTGRGLEQMMEAMKLLPETIQFWMAGEGDLSEKLRKQAKESVTKDRIRFLGYVLPDQLKEITKDAWLGYNLLENKGLNYYYSLANKFFDYAHAGIPSLNPDFPEYRHHLAAFKTGYIVKKLTSEHITTAVNELFTNQKEYDRLVNHCWQARNVWNWQKEEKKLKKILGKVLLPDKTTKK